MWRNIVGQAMFQLAALFFLLYGIHRVPYFELPEMRSMWTHNHHIIHSTIIFNSFVMCQLFNEFNSRKLGNGFLLPLFSFIHTHSLTPSLFFAAEFNILRGIFTNIVFHSVMIFTIVVQFLIVQYGGDFAQTRPLTAKQWAACVAVGSLSLPVGNPPRTLLPLVVVVVFFSICFVSFSSFCCRFLPPIASFFNYWIDCSSLSRRRERGRSGRE
jgi:magnesium-transporting ATPase (P-type)